jgi:hypothetical protein
LRLQKSCIERERDSFVQDDQTRQDVPSQTFTGQDLTEQGVPEIGKECIEKEKGICL